MVKLTGAVPSQWQSYWQSRKSSQQSGMYRLSFHRSSEDLTLSVEPSPAASEAEWARRRANLRPGCRDDADADQLVELLRKVLVLEPEKRPTTDEVLQDPWFHDDRA